MERDELDKDRLSRVIAALVQKVNDLQKLIDDHERRIKVLEG